MHILPQRRLSCVHGGKSPSQQKCPHHAVMPRPQAVQTTATLHDEAALYQKLADRAAKARETADAQPVAEGRAAARQGKARGRRQGSLQSAGASRVRRPASGEQQQRQQPAAEQAKAATLAASDPQQQNAAPEHNAANVQQQGAEAFREVDPQQSAAALPQQDAAAPQVLHDSDPQQREASMDQEDAAPGPHEAGAQDDQAQQVGRPSLEHDAA